jgi:TrpR-related protein YerC/YecD
MYVDKKSKEELKQFFQAVLSLKDNKECYAFFHDVLSLNEIERFAQRFKVARMLREGFTFAEIQEEIKASTTTISRVKYCLNCGGFHNILERFPTPEG